MTGPATLDRTGIAARIPHRDRMCLLDRLVGWTAGSIDCRSASHRDADNPLRSASGLLAPCAIEYAAQAMALHGSLVAPAGDVPKPGYLASVRQVRLAVATLHDVAGELHVRATRLAGDARQILYQFSVGDDGGRVLAEGRATVVLNTLPETPA